MRRRVFANVLGDEVNKNHAPDFDTRIVSANIFSGCGRYSIKPMAEMKENTFEGNGKDSARATTFVLPVARLSIEKEASSKMRFMGGRACKLSPLPAPRSRASS
jgi:hypothetical protein